MSEWNSIVYSGTTDTFRQLVDRFASVYSASHSAAWNYIKTTWMPHQEKFVASFINQFPHFGSSSTSRVEGSHHVIKSYVRLGKLDLLVVFKRLGLMLSNQKMVLNAEIERQKLIRAHHLDHGIFKDLHYRVLQFALDKIHEQFQFVSDQQCTGQFTKHGVCLARIRFEF